jgi:subtilisin family serine protease
VRVRDLVIALVACFGAAAPVRSGEAVWVFLADKSDASGLRVSWRAGPAEASRQQLDLPLTPTYLQAVAATGAHARHHSRWFNAVSVNATRAQAQDLRALPFVIDVRPVRALRRAPDADSPGPQAAGRWAAAPNYGDSFEQIAAVGGHLLHARDILGQGIRIALIDAGFNWRDHRAFVDLHVIAERDFLNHDDYVGDELDEPVTGNEVENGQNQHGTQVLGVIGGFESGHLIGMAPRAQYLLAKTEDARLDERGFEQDSPTEEDRWIAALEWADSLGAQVVNSSLGYTTFDDGTGYTYDDLDGGTALTTRAAELAVARGIVVVASAGNEARQDWHYITVPADGAGVVAVGAVHPMSSALASFSSRGPTADGRIKPDVVAPGQLIVTVSGRGAGSAADPHSLQEYRRLSGTSFSAPIVSGACALLLQLHPEWTPAEVADALRSTATDLGPAGPDTLFGWGLIDVARASGLEAIVPDHSMAAAPFPNPAVGPSPTIHFPVALHTAEDVSLSLFDIAGDLVDRIESRHLPPGEYSVAGLAPSWDVPAHLADGVYYYVLTGTTFRHTGKVAVLRGR